MLVVDDSLTMRSLLSAIIRSQDDMELVGTAPDARTARVAIKQADPDVITLDIEMPDMNGLEFLERIMRLRPMPVVMLSSLTRHGSDATLRALEIGAVDFISKPHFTPGQVGMTAFAEELTHKLRVAARSRVSGVAPGRENVPRPAASALPPLRNRRMLQDRVIAVGASTGGPEALRHLLVPLPVEMPPILVTQHMPAGFTRAFAERLNGLCQLTVKEAVQGEVIRSGHVYIAPGHLHLLLGRSGGTLMTLLSEADPVNRHRPSVEVLFDSVAQYVGRQAVGVMLTGMGKDGAVAMLRMRQAGAYNFAQDEASCVVYGMPREAVLLGAVHEELSIEKMPGRLVSWLESIEQDALVR